LTSVAAAALRGAPRVFLFFAKRYSPSIGRTDRDLEARPLKAALRLPLGISRRKRPGARAPDVSRDRA